MEDLQSINKTNQLEIEVVKRPKYGGRKAIDSQSKTIRPSVSEREYQLIKVLRDKHLLDMCFDFALNN